MKKHFFFCLTALSVFLLVTSCSDDVDDRIPKRRPDQNNNQTTGQEILITPLTDSASEALGGRQTGANPNDLLSNHTFDRQVTISFSEGNVQVEGAEGITVQKQQAHLSLSCSLPNVEYILSGSAANGSFTINSTHPYKLTLSNLTLTNENTVLKLESNSKAFVNIPEGTSSSLTNHIVYSDDPNAAVCYSSGNFVLNGRGNLSLLGEHTSGIVCQGSLRVALDVQAVLKVKAKKDGIRTKAAYIGDSGTINVDTQELNGEGNTIAVTNGYLIINGGDYSLKAKSNALMTSPTSRDTDPYITINGGTFSISAWAKGITTPSTLTLSNAEINLNSIDTAIEGNKGVYINKGTYILESTSGNTLSSEQLASFSAGRTFLRCKDTSTPISVPASGTFDIKGGTLIALGGRPQQGATLSEGSQPSFIFFSNFQANTLLHLREAEREVFTYLNTFDSSYLLFTSSKLIPDKKYDFYKGGTLRDALESHNLYYGGYYKAGNHLTYFTANKTINP